MAFGEWKSWEDKDVCKEIYLHRKLKEPFCKDCQEYWDSWNPFKRGQAMINGRNEYARYVMEDAGRDAIEEGYLSSTNHRKTRTRK